MLSHARLIRSFQVFPYEFNEAKAENNNDLNPKVSAPVLIIRSPGDANRSNPSVITGNPRLKLKAVNNLNPARFHNKSPYNPAYLGHFSESVRMAETCAQSQLPGG